MWLYHLHLPLWLLCWVILIIWRPNLKQVECSNWIYWTYLHCNLSMETYVNASSSLVGVGIYVHDVCETRDWFGVKQDDLVFGPCQNRRNHFHWFWSSNQNFGIDGLVDFSFPCIPVCPKVWILVKFADKLCNPWPLLPPLTIFRFKFAKQIVQPMDHIVNFN